MRGLSLSTSQQTFRFVERIENVSPFVVHTSFLCVLKATHICYIFDLFPHDQAMQEARGREVEIGYYSVVYDIIEEMQARMQRVLSPTPDGVLSGKAEVKAIFDIGKVGKIAGCMVTEGSVSKAASVRVMRGAHVVYEGSLRALKSFKANVQTVENGNECGINFVDWEEMEVGDVVECYTTLD
jgi:translation initiation factor IF-2